jgi:hypothetical protein
MKDMKLSSSKCFMGLTSILHKIYGLQVKKDDMIEHVAGTGEVRNHYRILIGKPE